MAPRKDRPDFKVTTSTAGVPEGAFFTVGGAPHTETAVAHEISIVVMIARMTIDPRKTFDTEPEKKTSTERFRQLPHGRAAFAVPDNGLSSGFSQRNAIPFRHSPAGFDS
jgi:hypothetical protein